MHRNVWGPTNGDFHLRMKEYYEEAFSRIDDIAERLAQLWIVLPLKKCELVNQSYIAFLKAVPSSIEDAIMINIKLHEHMETLLRTAIEKATDARDYYTEDMCRWFCAWHIKEKRKLEKLCSKSLSMNNVHEESNTMSTEEHWQEVN